MEGGAGLLSVPSYDIKRRVLLVAGKQLTSKPMDASEHWYA